ncbi:hypothetical protein COS64_03705 [archaeon CG06_land_8_20_14_3_00_37_11]|nr:MAG: hypothetical protein COS64_03705 [archaeon CG06_land_8_20_14_3_00_37_11]
MVEDELSNYYIKLGISGQVKTGLSNSSYLLKELKKLLNALNGFRQKKAELRKEVYEMLISIRLNMDNLINHLPHHEASRLQKEIDKIEDYHRSEAAKKKFEKKELPSVKFKKLKLTDIKGLGRKSAELLKSEMGIKSVDDLEKAAEAGKLREISGFGIKMENQVLQSIRKLKSKETSSAKKKLVEKKAEKKENIMDGALNSEKRELELLKQDLENISRELQKKQ